MSKGVTVILATLGLMIAFMLYPRKREHGFIYESYPLSRFAWGSGANQKNTLKAMFGLLILGSNNSLTNYQYGFLDEFRFLPEFISESRMNGPEEKQKKRIHLCPLHLREGLSRQNGQRKDHLLQYLLVQPFYNRAVVHDVKQDTIQTLYVPRKDLILCPYDERSCLWDIMNEDEEPLKHSFLTT